MVDGAPQPAFTSMAGAGSYALATGLPAGEHTVALYRQTEGPMGLSQLHGLTVGDGALLAPSPAPQRLIEVVGDSISCGYGIRARSTTTTATAPRATGTPTPR